MQPSPCPIEYLLEFVMSKFFDALETRDPAERERDLMARLPRQIAHAKSRSAHFASALAAVDAASINTRAALAQLPVLRKHALIELQKQQKPFGGLTATAMNGLGRVFSSPGPIYDPEGRAADWWRFARSLYAAGFRAGELVHNTFSYHFTPAGFMVEGGAQKIGCCVFPAGIGQTEMQVAAIADLRPAAYVGTPSFLKIIIDKADELKADIGSLKRAVVSGEALFPAQKALFAERGIACYQAYGTADLGFIGYDPLTIWQWLITNHQTLTKRLAIFIGELIVVAILAIVPIITIYNHQLDHEYKYQTMADISALTSIVSARYCMAIIIMGIMTLFDLRIPNKSKDELFTAINLHLDKAATKLSTPILICMWEGFWLMIHSMVEATTRTLRDIGVLVIGIPNIILCIVIWSSLKFLSKLPDLEWRLPVACSGATGAIIFVFFGVTLSVLASSAMITSYLILKRPLSLISQGWWEEKLDYWEFW